MSENTARYDLIVIGSGPAGEKGAAQAAYFGKRVALLEKGALGGAAANTGTLPSKTLRETALFLSGFRQRELYGVDASLRERATIQDLLTRERQVRDIERRRIAENLCRHRIDFYQGAARFIDPHTLEVGDARLHGDFVLLATGSRPYHPEAFPFGAPGILDSDTILEMDRLPGSLLIAGGGVIGCEYACVFATLGIPVTLVEPRDRLLSFLDAEIAQGLMERMEDLGVAFRMCDVVRRVEPAREGWRATLESGESLTTETILIASGRCGNTERLNLEAAGVPVGRRGQVAVNENYQSAAPHIYAAGDVIGFPALASTSMEQARLAMCHAFGLDYKPPLAPILPYGVYTIPEVSMAGLTEEEAKAKGIDAVAGRARFADNARGQIIGDRHGVLKLVFRREDMRLLGVHVLGEMASELVHIGLTALLCEAGAELFIRTCYNYPTLSETYKYATYDALGRRQRAQA